MSKHTVYYNLRDALIQSTTSAAPTCPVCILAAKSVAGFLDSLLYELVNDSGMRQEIREARGFCNEHAWQLRTIGGGALGVAIIYRDVLEMTLKLIRRGRFRRPQPLSLQRLQGALSGDQAGAGTVDLVAALEPEAECPACRHRRTAEDIYLSTLLEHLDDEDVGSAFRTSAGLCLPHFRQALQLVEGEAVFARLVEIEAACLERLGSELSEFIRKHDYRFTHEGFGAEGNSWIRAIGQMSAQKGIR